MACERVRRSAGAQLAPVRGFAPPRRPRLLWNFPLQEVLLNMKIRSLLSSALIGAVASARSMTPMATLAAARLAGRRTPGQPLAYLTLAGRKQAMARIGQTRSGLIEDALIVAAGAAVVALATRAIHAEAAAPRGA